jgi:hypothetical protein
VRNHNKHKLTINRNTIAHLIGGSIGRNDMSTSSGGGGKEDDPQMSTSSGSTRG